MLKFRYRAALFCVVAALIFLAVVFGSLASSATYNYCVGHNGEYATGRTYEKGSPIVEPAIDKPTPINLFVYCGGIYANENGAGITALATVLLTIVTALLCYLAWDQGRTGRSQLRAYIMIASTANTQISPAAIPQITIRIKNFGQTPAHNVKVALHTQFTSYPFTGEFEFVDPAAEFGRPLGPQDDLSMVVIWEGCTLTADKIRAMVESRWALRMNAQITYEDIFDRQHETKFAVFYNGITGMTLEDPSGGKWGAIDALNRST